MSPGAVAIVGMACRYPEADDPTMLFENVLARRRAFRSIPPQRLSADYFGEPSDAKIYLQQAGVLTGWEFPRGDFGISRSLHSAADHAHWLALQVADEALADAGFDAGEGLARERVGVVLGNTLTGEFSRAASLRLRTPFFAARLRGVLEHHDVAPDLVAEVVDGFSDSVRSCFAAPDDNSLAGALSNTIAGRICNHFDFGGLGYTVDGACSSSLLSIQLAAQAIVDGQLDFALAGGVDLSLDPFELVGFAQLGALARDDMRIYDASPTGFIPGEGCGVVALMPAAEAIRQSRRIYAWIGGWGISSDGSGGLTRPVAAGQLRAHRRAYSMAGLGPEAVELVEGHGTGTVIGDEVELEVLRTLRAAVDRPARLGSVKANIGHTKAAAGTAGLIKAALAVYHGIKPPTTGCDTPHPALEASRQLLEAGVDADEFRADIPRASVSALGFGGINCTMLVSGAPRPHHAGGLGGSSGGATSAPLSTGPRVSPGNHVANSDLRRWARPRPDAEVLVIGAGSKPALRRRLVELGSVVNRLSQSELADLAVDLVRAGDHRRPYRAGCFGATPAEVATSIDAATASIEKWTSPQPTLDPLGRAVLASGPAARIGLLFPGQAAPVRANPPRWAAGLPREVPAPAFDRSSGGTEAAQPLIVYQSLIGSAWLDAMGCRPVTAIGHSLGELCAYAHAGALSAEAVLDLAVQRGRLMAAHGLAQTTMAGISAPEQVVERVIDGTGVEVAGVNSPNQTVVAGDRDGIGRVVAEARRLGLSATELPVSHGFHSQAMVPVRDLFAEVLAGVDLGPPQRRCHSTVSGGPLPDGADLRGLLVSQLTEPVRFADCIESAKDEVDVFVEVGPGAILTGLVGECGFDGLALALDIGGEESRLALGAATLLATGAADPHRWFANRPGRPFDPDRSQQVLVNPCEVEVESGRTGTTSGDADAPVRSIQRPVVSEPVGGGSADAADSLSVLRRELARLMDLDVSQIAPSASLLADLHFTSLQAVEIADSLVRARGKEPPASPLAVATATVEELADLVDELPPLGAGDLRSVAGVGPWVRAFEHRLVSYEPPEDNRRTDWVRWDVGPASGSRPQPTATDDEAAIGIAVNIGDDAGPDQLAPVATALAGASVDKIAIIASSHTAARGLARALSAELPRVAVTSFTAERPIGDEDLRRTTRNGYLELFAAADGGYQRPMTTSWESAGGVRGEHREPQAADRSFVLGQGDVCVVTGGVAGITIECAMALARETGVRILVVGRSPVDSAKVRSGLAALPDDIDISYRSCDIGDSGSVAQLVETAATLGRVTGLIHGAAVNDPRLVTAVTPESLRAHLNPKVDGLGNLLEAFGPELDLVVTFGSIIGRCGLEGQSEYCIANDSMTGVIESWARDNPTRRVRNIEWSVWSGSGMGVRLGVVDRLERSGVAPIPPRLGVEAFLGAVGAPSAPTTLTVSGRFPPSPRLWQDGLDRPLLDRFQEQVMEYSPGIELICQPAIDLVSDPYHDDHRVDGRPVLPAVMGLEAMVQVAAGCLPEADAPGWVLSDVDLRAPVFVASPDEGGELQLAALAGPESVEVVLRSSTDRFATDRFTTTVERSAGREEPKAGSAAEVQRRAVDGVPLYGPLFFHGDRFRVVDGYSHLSAYNAEFGLVDTNPNPWFSDFHSQNLLLGSPALNDGIIHGLLATLPATHALPVAVEQVTIHRPAEGSLRVVATQVGGGSDEYVFDVTASADTGCLVSSWKGLRVRATDTRSWTEGRIPIGLVGPWVSRRLDQVGWPQRVELWVEPGARDDRSGSGDSVRHVATRSRSYLAAPECSLEAEAEVPIGVDWEPVVSSPPLLSGPESVRLADVLAADHGLDRERASMAVWTMGEALVKIGEDPDTRLVVKHCDDGLVWLSSERVAVVAMTVPLLGADPLSVAVAVAS